MKKRMSRILSILLVSVLVISTAEVAHAEDAAEPVSEEVQAEEVVEETAEEVTEKTEEVSEPITEEAEPEVKKEEKKEESKTEEAAPAQVSEEAEEVPEMSADNQQTAAKVLESMDVLGEAKEIDTQATVAGSIPVKIAVTGTEVPDVGVVSYNYNNVKGTKCGYSQTVTFSAKGTVSMAVAVDASSSANVSFGIFRDANMTTPVDSEGYAYKGEDASSKVFRIPSAGTYYIGLYSNRGSNYQYRVAAAAIFYNGADRTLTNGAQVAVGQKDAQTNYFAFKAVSNGYITAMGDASANYNKVAICNSSKKALSGDTYLRYQPVYGVQKGKTYYIRVTSSYNSDGGYVFKVTNSKITEKSGKKKSKAVTIKKNKTKKGTIVAGSSQADWYKFKKTNKKKMVITVKGRTNDTFKVIVYKGKKKYTSYTFNYTSGGGKINCYNYPKGTYYIKIQRANKNSSGWYSLKWK